MERKPASFDRYALVSATSSTRHRVDAALAFAAKLQNDPERAKRLAAGKCVYCYYGTGIGGAAITQQPCACCLTPQTYASTNTDALCLPCAKEHSLCKHCSADMDLRERRRNWPTRATSPHPAS